MLLCILVWALLFSWNVWVQNSGTRWIDLGGTGDFKEAHTRDRSWETWNYWSRGREISGCKSVENQDSLVLCSQNFSLCSCFSDSRAHLLLTPPNMTSPSPCMQGPATAWKPSAHGGWKLSNHACSKTFLFKSVFQTTAKRRRYTTTVRCFQPLALECSSPPGMRHSSVCCACAAGSHLLRKTETVFVWVTWEHENREYKPVLFPRDCHSHLACLLAPACWCQPQRYKNKVGFLQDRNKCLWHRWSTNTGYYWLLCPNELLWPQF